MKILVLGWYYAANLGDAVICECVSGLLQKAFPNAEVRIADLNGRECFERGSMASLKKLKKSRIKEAIRHAVTRSGVMDMDYRFCHDGYLRHEEVILQACHRNADADLVVFAGGQLFMDGLTLPVAAWVHELERHGIPMLFNACGTGPAASPKLRGIYRLALMSPCVKWISSRDRADYVEHYYLDKKRSVVPVSDPALWTAEVFRKDILDMKSRGMLRDTIGLGVMFPESLPTEKSIRFWIRLIRLLDREGVHWCLFVNGRRQDITYAESILDRMPEYSDKKGERIVPPPETPADLVKQISGFRGIIAFRLHSSIIACSTGVPAAAIVWDNKLREFYKSIGHPERCFTIGDDPEIVWKGYCRAEKDGYPCDDIRKMKEHSQGALLEQVRRYV